MAKSPRSSKSPKSPKSLESPARGESSLLGGLTPAEFLKNHWQKKPLLVRGAFPDFKDPVTPDELAGLAMEEGVQARLVLERGGKKPWELHHGPFSEKRLSSLPRSHWSLLVSRVNEYVEDAALMLDRFRFLPHWRMDDLMVSFAPDHGTVGAHVDSYDVFLVQGLGRRRWQISTQADTAFKPGLDLKILKSFVAEEEWVLEPGDMLYLPPGVAHYGVALEPCLTYSVGFRAPPERRMILDFLNTPADAVAVPDELLYEDPELTPTSDPGEISPAALAKIRGLMLESVARPDVVGRWFGAFITRPDEGSPGPQATKCPTPATLEKRLQGDCSVWRADDARVAWLRPSEGHLYFYVNGAESTLSLEMLPLVKSISSARRTSGAEVVAALPRGKAARQTALALLADLIRERVLVLK